MRDLINRALNTGQSRGATYADIRVVSLEIQEIVVKNGVVHKLATERSLGFGIRALADGAWGFASSHQLEADEVDRIAAQAVDIARASALAKVKDVNLGPREAHVNVYRTPVEIDPFAVSPDAKVRLLLETDRECRAVRGVSSATSHLIFSREHKTFASTEGSFIEQEIVETGLGLVARATAGREVQTRSYPNSGIRPRWTGGYEIVNRWDLPGHARQVGEEAAALLSACQCPSATTTLILDGPQLAVQLHESCGHPIELDRVFGSEAAFAGTSFLTPDKYGRFRFGSKCVNIRADAVTATGLGTFGYDDEGVPAQSTDIVRDGMFIGYLTSRETASRLRELYPSASERSNGSMRADGWGRVSLVRMTNVNLLPGEWTFEDLIADTDEGVYMLTNKSWSIDDKRLNFQFGTEASYEIRNGKIGRLFKNPTYTGITPQFWNSCDAVCNATSWRMWGTPNCGKGQPYQLAHSGHGVAPARFRNIEIGATR